MGAVAHMAARIGEVVCIPRRWSLLVQVWVNCNGGAAVRRGPAARRSQQRSSWECGSSLGQQEAQEI
jgi:hypothetical protein